MTPLLLHLLISRLLIFWVSGIPRPSVKWEYPINGWKETGCPAIDNNGNIIMVDNQGYVYKIDKTGNEI